jgi:CRP/FNR family transcriptional regulator, cyclic AMP receptor protein
MKSERKDRYEQLDRHFDRDLSNYAGNEEAQEPIMTPAERLAINSGRWFGGLSPALKHDILRHVFVKHYRDGELILARGEPPNEWLACAKGAARVSSTSLAGKQIIFAYIEPGIWFGDVSMFDGDKRTHDVYAHGDTTMVCVSRADFQKILSLHVELYEALMRLQARRIRQLFGLLDDLNTLPLRARLAKQLLHLKRSYGVAALNHPGEFRISLHLAQEELAQLLGASRQRVNQELKSMEREEAIRIEPGGIVIRNRELLLKISTEAAHH